MVKCVGRKSCIVHRVTNTSNESRVRCLLLLLLTSYFLLLTFGFAQDGGVPGALLNYGMSPRTIAMGKAFTGLADDQEAAYYNPAGLTQLLSHNIKTSYLSLWRRVNPCSKSCKINNDTNLMAKWQ